MKQLVQPWLFLLTHVSSCYAKAQRKCGDEACCHHWSDNLKLIHPFKAMTGEALRVSNCIEVIKRVKCIEVSLSGAPSYEFSDTLLSIGSPHTLRLLVRAKMAKTFTVQPTARSMGHHSPIHPIPTSSRPCLGFSKSNWSWTGDLPGAEDCPQLAQCWTIAVTCLARLLCIQHFSTKMPKGLNHPKYRVFGAAASLYTLYTQDVPSLKCHVFLMFLASHPSSIVCCFRVE